MIVDMGDDKKMFEAFVQTRSLSWPELGRALLRRNEKLLMLVSGAEGWSPQKIAAMRAEFGDLSTCYLVDDGERVTVLTRDPAMLQSIMRTDQMLTLLELSVGKPN
jgi:hypothetical protein